jgi:Na+-driven multidrug efflux pump
MGNCVQNMVGLSVVIGLNGAFETLASQAKGSGRPEMIGIFLNRGKIIVLVTNFFVLLILSRTSWFLILIGQNVEVSIIS